MAELEEENQVQVEVDDGVPSSEDRRKQQLNNDIKDLQDGKAPAGLYTCPGPKSSDVNNKDLTSWYGVMFIHSGFYKEAIWKFHIEIPENYPPSAITLDDLSVQVCNIETATPKIHFINKMFHPLIDPNTGELIISRLLLESVAKEKMNITKDTINQFGGLPYTSLTLIDVLKLIRNIFHQKFISEILEENNNETRDIIQLINNNENIINKDCAKLFITDRRKFARISGESSRLSNLATDNDSSYSNNIYNDDTKFPDELKFSNIDPLRFAAVKEHIIFNEDFKPSS